MNATRLSIRQDNGIIEPISGERLAAIAPQIFNAEPSPVYQLKIQSGISRYTVLPGILPHDILTQAGWIPVRHHAITPKVPELARYMPYQTDYVPIWARFEIGRPLPMITIRNSYDGVLMFSPHAGIFDPRCTNGMVMATLTMPTCATRHDGKMDVQDIASQVSRIVDGVGLIGETLARFQSYRVTLADQLNIAHACIKAIMPQHVGKIAIDEITSPLYRYQLAGSPDGSRDAYTFWSILQSRLIQQGAVTIRGKRNTEYKGVRDVLRVADANMIVFRSVFDHVNGQDAQARLFADSHGLPSPSSGNTDIMAF